MTKAIYIGNCTEIGNPRKYISNFFEDATELSNIVEDSDNYKKISFDVFLENVSIESVPKKALKGISDYFYVRKNNTKLKEAKLFYIYNLDQDIHYFFSK